MARIKRGTTTHQRHKKIIKLAKGYRGRAGTCFKVANERVEKGLQYAYRDRRNRRRNFRALWIQRINAGVRQHGMVYSQFMNGLVKAGITLDRKILADIAVHDEAGFKALVEQAQNALKA